MHSFFDAYLKNGVVRFQKVVEKIHAASQPPFDRT